MNRRDLLKLSAAAAAGASLNGMPVQARETVRIEFTLFSAFYSPLIATIAGGFLEAEGLHPVFKVSAPGRTALDSIADGTADVVQTAPSQAFNALKKGQKPTAVHFASINEKDGFFLAARNRDAEFTWDKLHGKRVLVTPGVQPTTMFRYGCFKAGVDIGRVTLLEREPNETAMIAALRRGEADYIHLQGPAPQQLEKDGTAHIVAAFGDVIGPCAFSSLAASREWLGSDQARAFTRAYRKARTWLLNESAEVITARQTSFFKGTDPSVLTQTISTYQKLGNWTPDITIPRADFEATMDIFQYAGVISQRYAYEDVVVQPPLD